MKVADILKVKGGTLFTVTASTPLQTAIVTMAKTDIGSLLVMQDGKFEGILTFREVISALAQSGSPSKTVGEVMLRDTLVVTTQTELSELRLLMLERHARYVPVLDGVTVCGVISFFDVARAVADEQDRENQQLRGYIHDIPN